MTMHDILETIKNELTKEGLDSFIQREEENFPKLLIYTGSNQEKTQVIEIVAQNTDVASAIGCLNLQLNAVFPFTVKESATTDVAQFLHFLNLQLEVPGLFLNLLDQTIVYRYVFLAEPGHVPTKNIMSLIGLAMFYQDVFGQVLEKLSKDEVTFVGLMEEIQGILEKATKQ